MKWKDKPKVIFINKNNALIEKLSEIMIISHHILSIWHINKNFMGYATKFFKDLD